MSERVPRMRGAGAEGAGAVLVAAGRSTRLGGEGLRKPFLELEGRTILEHACAAFDACALVEEIVLVVHADDLARAEALREDASALRKVRAIVPGGNERTDSVTSGVEAVSAELALVAVHDAARPLIAPGRIEAVLRAAASEGAAVLALRARDTVKESDDGRHAARTLERTALWLAQTPQAFRASELRDVLREAAAEGFRPTDDAALWERYRGPVALVEGDATNLKVTGPEDLELARALLRARAGVVAP